MGKIDYKVQLASLYQAAAQPVLVEVPELGFVMIDGHGDPNSTSEYAEAVQALYAVSYAAKFAVKRAVGLDYTVMPLEGLWSVPRAAEFAAASPSEWDWTLLIYQPEAVTEQVFSEAIAKASSKCGSEVLRRVRLEHFREGLAAQLLYTGPYAAEGPTIQALHAFIAEGGHQLTGRHHEIYLSDPRRVPVEKLRTILRQPVRTA